MKYSKHGYKRNSKDVNNPYNVIGSGNITMEGVDFPVMGIDNFGNQELMMPGANYKFPGNSVFEVPLQNFPRHFQQGGSLPKFQGDVNSSETKSKATVFLGDDYGDYGDNMFEADFNRMEADLIKKYGEGNYQVVRAADIQNEMNNILNSGKTPVDFSIDEYNRLKKLRDDRGNLLVDQAYQTHKKNFPNDYLSQYNTLNEMYEDQSGTAEEQMKRMGHYEEYIMRPSYNAAFDNDEEYIQFRDNLSDYQQNKAEYDKRQNAFKSLSSEDKLKYYKTYFENMGEGSDVYMLKHGDNMFLSKAGTLSEGTRNDFNYGNTPGKIDTFTEAMTAWGPATTGTCYMGVCNGLPGAAHITNETGMTTKAQKGNWAGYYDRSGAYGNDQTFDEQFFNPLNTDVDKSGGTYNTYTKEADRIKVLSTPMDYPTPMNPYFLEGTDSSKWDDHWNKALGGSIPKAQDGSGTPLLNTTPNLLSPLGSLYNYGLDKVKNKIADNLNPYSYHDPFQRLYDAIFTTENKTDANFKHNDEKIERRDLLHMLMNLDQENNSIPQQNQYTPTKGHREGDVYYNSPVTETEIKHHLSRVGKNRKENFFLDKNYQREEEDKWTDKELEEFWTKKQNEYLDDDIYVRLIHGENYDEFNNTYKGKEITSHKIYVEADPDKYVHFTDTPQYDEFLKSDGYDAWANKMDIERENEIDYPDAESLMTKPGNEEEGTRQTSGFYGGVLGDFTLNQGEDEQGKYFSYYDKWDLDPFKGDGDWKETLSEFGQKHILGVSPTQIYNRMYYTTDDQGNYVFKYGGSLPKVQNGGFDFSKKFDYSPEAIKKRQSRSWKEKKELGMSQLGYDQGEEKDLVMDVGSIFHPGFDLAHAVTKANEGEYLDAALYATFGILPFSAKPLVHGTKKAINFFKKIDLKPVKNLVENAKQADILDYNISKRTVNDSRTGNKDVTFPIYGRDANGVKGDLLSNAAKNNERIISGSDYNTVFGQQYHFSGVDDITKKSIETDPIMLQNLLRKAKAKRAPADYKGRGAAEESGFSYEPFFFGASGNQHRGYGKNAYSYNFKPDAKIYNSWDVDITRITPKEFETLKNAGFDAVTSKSRGLAFDEMIIINKNSLKDFKGVNKKSIEYENLYDRNRHYVNRTFEEIYIPKNVNHPDFKTKHWDDIANTTRKDYYDKYGTYTTLPIDQYAYGGSLPKAQFGWNDFEDSKIGKFVDAKGLRRDGEHFMNTVGNYFGYENTPEDARRMTLDGSAMVNPMPDFINAYDHAQQGKYTDAALYAGFGILPFSAGPLVKGTKKHIINPVKNLFKSTPTPRGTALNKYGQIKTTFDDLITKDVSPINNATGKKGNYLIREGNLPVRGPGSDLKIQVHGDVKVDKDWMVQIGIDDNRGFAQLVKDAKNPNMYSMDISMKSPLEAGQTINYLAEYVPKGSIVSSNSLSMDSYKLMTNQIKRGKFSYVPNDRTIQLNMMSKKLSKIDMNNAGMVSKTEADKIVKEVNKMLDNAGIKQRATVTKAVEDAKDVLNYPPKGPHSTENFLTWQVNIPELAVEVNFKDGGSLPKFQDVGETTYPVEVIQYPLGYKGGQGTMLPGHIEARYLGDLTGTDYEGQKGYVNRWVNSGNRPVSYNAKTDYEDGVRTSIMNLNEEEFDHYMNTAQTFTSGDEIDIPLVNLSLATSFGGADTDYDFVDSNCADGLCSALGMNSEDYTTLGVTTPNQVMDAIVKDNRTKSSTGQSGTGEKFLKTILNPIDAIQGLFDFQEGGQPSTIVPLQKEGKSEEIDAFGYKGYFDFNQEPINMDDDQDGHKGYLFVYTEGPSAGGSYWRPLENKYSGSRWEKSGQVEEYNAYFTNPNLIDEHWDKGSAVALKIKEAVKNNILYSELPKYLKDVNTWRTISPNRDLEKELKELDKKQDGEEVSVSFDDLEKGIRHVESINGTLMKNKQSSASGYYGDLFDNLTYDGTRDEFIADIDFQKKRFKQRYNGEIKDVPGLKSNGIDIYNEYKDQVDFTYTPTEIAALSNLLGRQGTREYFGNVLRDGETLESVFPNLYGDGRQLGADGEPLENKTPEQYIQKFKEAVNKKTGGEFVKKVKRLNQQLKKYNQGGIISPLAYQELLGLNMIKPKVEPVTNLVEKDDNLVKEEINNNTTFADLEIGEIKKGNFKKKKYGGDINPKVDSLEVNRLADKYNNYIKENTFMYEGEPVFSELHQRNQALKLFQEYNEKAPESFKQEDIYNKFFKRYAGNKKDKDGNLLKKLSVIPKAQKFDIDENVKKTPTIHDNKLGLTNLGQLSDWYTSNMDKPNFGYNNFEDFKADWPTAQLDGGYAITGEGGPEYSMDQERKPEKLIKLPSKSIEQISTSEVEGPKKVAPYELTKNNPSYFTISYGGAQGTWKKEDGLPIIQLKDQAGRVVWKGSQTEYEEKYGDFLEKGDTEYGERKKHRLYLRDEEGVSLPPSQTVWDKRANENVTYKSGGEFGTDQQEKFYEEYINGVFKNTKEEAKAKKLFDKLNRIYYNDSKNNNMQQLDIIKSINRQG